MATAGFMTHVICRLTAKNRDQLWNPLRSAIEYGITFTFFYCSLYAVNEDLQHLSTARMPVEYVVCWQGSQARAEVA